MIKNTTKLKQNYWPYQAIWANILIYWVYYLNIFVIKYLAKLETISMCTF